MHRFKELGDNPKKFILIPKIPLFLKLLHLSGFCTGFYIQFHNSLLKHNFFSDTLQWQHFSLARVHATKHGLSKKNNFNIGTSEVNHTNKRSSIHF